MYPLTKKDTDVYRPKSNQNQTTEIDMQKNQFIALLLISGCSLGLSAEERTFATEQEKASYYLGIMAGKSHERRYGYLNDAAFLEGVGAALQNTSITEQEAKDGLVQFLSLIHI